MREDGWAEWEGIRHLLVYYHILLLRHCGKDTGTRCTKLAMQHRAAAKAVAGGSGHWKVVVLVASCSAEEKAQFAFFSPHAGCLQRAFGYFSSTTCSRISPVTISYSRGRHPWPRTLLRLTRSGIEATCAIPPPACGTYTCLISILQYYYLGGCEVWTVNNDRALRTEGLAIR